MSLSIEQKLEAIKTGGPSALNQLKQNTGNQTSPLNPTDNINNTNASNNKYITENTHITFNTKGEKIQ